MNIHMLNAKCYFKYYYRLTLFIDEPFNNPGYILLISIVLISTVFYIVLR